MASRKGKISSDTGWAVSIHEWAQAMQEATGCELQISCRATRRVGVLRVSVRALEVVDGRPAGIRCQVGGEWPCSDSLELLPYVYQLLLRLDSKMAQDALLPPGD